MSRWVVPSENGRFRASLTRSPGHKVILSLLKGPLAMYEISCSSPLLFKLCCTMNGFSLHGARAINTLNRSGLEQLISYIARGPFSNDRITLCPGERVKLALKLPFSDGTTHLLMSYGEFIEKLTALIPPPRSHSFYYPQVVFIYCEFLNCSTFTSIILFKIFLTFL